MKIQNIRMGFATNSSSMHSICFSKHALKDILPEYGDQQFGWDFFRLASKEQKMKYLGQIINQNLNLPDWMRSVICQSITGQKLEISGDIDHQSSIGLPSDWTSTGLDLEFIKDFKDYLATPGIIIYGGNDNASIEKIKEFQLGINANIGELNNTKKNWIARRDGSFWVLFDKDTGNKISLSFTEIGKRPRPSFPELIDLKITDQCCMNCSYCYQNSTKNGKHAEYKNIIKILQDCKDNKVFEIALGGGEPTSYPNFSSFLYKNRCPVINYTTKNFLWVMEHKNDKHMAYSVDSIKAMERFCKLDSKASIQYVMGSTNEYVFKTIMKLAEQCDIKVTLLGYKYFGRGKNKKPENYKNWLRGLRAIPRIIGIDTVLAKELDMTGIPKYLYYTKEGQYSMYIDAIKNRAAASSFTNKTILYKNLKQAWRDIVHQHKHT